MTAEWRWKKDDWRRHFKKKIIQAQAHHHRKPWIKSLKEEKMREARKREGARNFVPRMRSKL